jgi:predicted DNA-binding transcriptional regulator AlpA
MGTVHNTIERLLNEHDVAEMLGVSVATVRRWRLLKTGPKYLKVGVLVKYQSSDLQRWLASRPTGGTVTETR